ncbi:hypothetical protein ACT8ZV_21700 [Nocardioides sp. MAHUQ-72]|uniref:hypothetical protein n=1 Tax=unclassified Nocardioides TaxID=2615069 RepID=UPI00360C2DE8
MSDHDAGTGWDDDPELRDRLRDRLRAADPASSLPPADPAWVARLLEDTMSNPTDTEVATESRATGTRGRGPLTWLVAAAAVLLIAGVGFFGLVNRGADEVPTAGDSPTVTELQAPTEAAYLARCPVPTAALLSRQTFAFDGTVRSIADGVVTLVPRHFYAGDPTDLVTVTAPQSRLQALVEAVQFEDGGRYLVSAADGRVTVCGFSAEYSPRLAGVYAQAFPAGA